MHDRHKIIRWVVKLRTIKPEVAGEIVYRLRSQALVDQFALDHQHKPIKQVEYFGVGLMNGHKDCLLLTLSQLLQVPYNDERGEGVESRSGLIQHQDLWIADQFKGNRSSFFLTS